MLWLQYFSYRRCLGINDLNKPGPMDRCAKFQVSRFSSLLTAKGLMCSVVRLSVAIRLFCCSILSRRTVATLCIKAICNVIITQ